MKKDLSQRIYTSIILLFLLFLIFLNNYILGYFLIIIGIFSLIEFFNLNKIIFKNNGNKQLVFNSLFSAYVFGFCSIFLLLSSFFGLKILVFIILITCILSDIGGFIFGKVLKGPKLTKISPKKTISGAIGSFIFSSLFFSSSLTYITKKLDFKIIIIGILISLSCQIGDLFFSYLKRKSSLKDFSKILPGHGGILDRIDSILLGLPSGLLMFMIVY